MVYDSFNNYLVMYGGKIDPEKGDMCSNELWFFNAETTNWF